MKQKDNDRICISTILEVKIVFSLILFNTDYQNYAFEKQDEIQQRITKTVLQIEEAVVKINELYHDDKGTIEDCTYIDLLKSRQDLETNKSVPEEVRTHILQLVDSLMDDVA